MISKKQVFNDGICSIHYISSNNKLTPVFHGIRYANKTVGSERFFRARDFQRTVNKLIRIPRIPEPEANGVIVIKGKQYNILQVQNIDDTMPKCWQLSLEEIKKSKVFEYA